MQKLYIAKNKYGKYYVKISNKYNRCDKIVSASLPKGMELPSNYGIYNCEYYLDCYQLNNGNVELAVRITRVVGIDNNVTNPEINPAGTQSLNAYEDYNNATPELPF